MSSSPRRFQQLEVWRASHSLTLDVYRVTQRLPDCEKYGLVSQMRRAAFSTPSNIVEGFKRRGVRDKSRFYNIAQASLEELRYFLLLCHDLGYDVDYENMEMRADQIARMLHALAENTRNSDNDPW